MCRFPPLRIRFERDAAAGSAFEGQRSLKLVTHCERGATHAQYVVQELLAYRIYNRITRHSFRVRPLAITYLGQGGRGGPGSHFAFVIEDLREVARRTTTGAHGGCRWRRRNTMRRRWRGSCCSST